MIATQCPACKTLFQLTDEEQTACGGTVRCGQCGTVFQAAVYRLGPTTPGSVDPARRPRRWINRLGITLLSIALLAQAVYWGRNTLNRMPWSHPLIHRVCTVIPCTLTHPATVAAYQFKELQITKGTRPGVLHIHARLINHASFMQSLPLLTIRLFSAHHRLLTTRSFQPSLYLVHPHAHLGAGQSAVLALNLRGPRSAARYQLILFPTRTQ